MANAKRRSSIRGGRRDAALAMGRIAVLDDKLVYVAVANKAIKYGQKRSNIIYVGTTKRGVDRVASSAASKAREMLLMHGVKRVEFFVYTCKPRQRVKMWHKLERALLLTFKDEFGCPPRFNVQGKNMIWKDEADYFSAAGLKNVIRKYSS